MRTRVVLSIAALSVAFLASAAPAWARGLKDPVANRSLPAQTTQLCYQAPAGAGCRSGVLAAINRARAGEGVRPMRLPADFSALSGAQQLFVVSNLERVDRGLVPILGLSRNLSRRASAAAVANQDPVPDPFYGNSFGSNWAGGYGSPLEADFAWMYDDGPGSFNIDCPVAGASGCWGHRHDILGPYQAPVVMGAAVVGVSMTELFVGGDRATKAGQPDALSAPLWPAVARIKTA